MNKDESWRKEPWAAANMERWATLRAQGFEFQNAPQRRNETGVIMSRQDWNFKLTVFVPYNETTTRQEVYEGWIDQCEQYIGCPPDWVSAAKEILSKGKVDAKPGENLLGDPGAGHQQ